MNDDDLDDFNQPVVEDLPLADEATAWMPGTAQKVAVMAERAARGRSVFHPGDARMDEPDQVRVPVQLNGYPNRIVGWEQMTEQEYREQNRMESHWRRRPNPWDEDEDELE